MMELCATEWQPTEKDTAVIFVTALLMQIEDWKQVVDSKQMVSVLSADIVSEAVDSLNHFLTV